MRGKIINENDDNEYCFTCLNMSGPLSQSRHFAGCSLMCFSSHSRIHGKDYKELNRMNKLEVVSKRGEDWKQQLKAYTVSKHPRTGAPPLIKFSFTNDETEHEQSVTLVQSNLNTVTPIPVSSMPLPLPSLAVGRQWALEPEPEPEPESEPEEEEEPEPEPESEPEEEEEQEPEPPLKIVDGRLRSNLAILQEAKEMLNQDLITQADYDEKKKEVLNRM